MSSHSGFYGLNFAVDLNFSRLQVQGCRAPASKQRWYGGSACHVEQLEFILIPKP